MFLAWKEIIRSKGKFSLIVVMIVLISYLVYFLTSLSYGLASSYTKGIDRWDAASIVLTSDSNDNAMMSVIDEGAYGSLEVSGDKARLGLTPTILKKASAAVGEEAKKNIYVFGLDAGSFLAPSQMPASGLADDEAIVDGSVAKLGYAVGDRVALVGSTSTFTITAFTSDSTYQTAPILYTNLAAWKQIRYGSSSVDAFSAAVVKGTITSLPSNLKSYSMADYVNTLPGYSAQVATFSLMIGFLIAIAAFVLGIFIYVLTIQKASMFGVMKAQGISGLYIGASVLAQTMILTFMGVAAGFGLTLLSGLFLAGKMPFAINPLFYAGITVAFFLFAALGSMFSIRAVLKIDPLKAIG